MNKHSHYQLIDVMRGCAIVLMFIYHFAYDLDYFGYIQQDFSHSPFWLNFRTLIVTLFLTIMGVSLYLAAYKKLNTKRFQYRLRLLIIYSLLVSLGSWVVFPDAMIFFGILHFITLASLIALFFVPLGKINLLFGISIIVIANTFSFQLFDHAYLQWFGMVTKLPTTVDYVPFLPWFGVVLIGLYLGQLMSSLAKNSWFKQWRSQHKIFKVLSLAGRNSLHIYMLHQPLFLGILYIINTVFQ